MTLVPNFGPRAFQALLETYSSLERILKENPKYSDADLLKKADQEIEKAMKKKVEIVTFFDERYPKALKMIYDPPVLLYVKGELPDDALLHIGVVGSRLTSLYGQKIAKKISGDLAERGAVIVSGMAVGIDAAAHRGALLVGGLTVAVLGSGLSRIYPPENEKLFHEIAEKGVVISEYPMEMKPLKQNFPIRNRIISGLSRALLVVEAKRNSGALITADLALEQGREVYAMPGQADAPTAGGSNGLLKEGAKLVTSAEDILEDLGVQSLKPAEVPVVDLSEDERGIFSLLGRKPLHVDELIDQAASEPKRVISILSRLEMKGLIRQLPGKNFIKK